MTRVELMFKIHSKPACILHTKRIPYKNTPQLTTLTHFLFGPPSLGTRDFPPSFGKGAWARLLEQRLPARKRAMFASKVREFQRVLIISFNF